MNTYKINQHIENINNSLIQQLPIFFNRKATLVENIREITYPPPPQLNDGDIDDQNVLYTVDSLHRIKIHSENTPITHSKEHWLPGYVKIKKCKNTNETKKEENDQNTKWSPSIIFGSPSASSTSSASSSSSMSSLCHFGDAASIHIDKFCTNEPPPSYIIPKNSNQIDVVQLENWVTSIRCRVNGIYSTTEKGKEEKEEKKDREKDMKDREKDILFIQRNIKQLKHTLDTNVTLSVEAVTLVESAIRNVSSELNVAIKSSKKKHEIPLVGHTRISSVFSSLPQWLSYEERDTLPGTLSTDLAITFRHADLIRLCNSNISSTKEGTKEGDKKSQFLELARLSINVEQNMDRIVELYALLKEHPTPVVTQGKAREHVLWEAKELTGMISRARNVERLENDIMKQTWKYSYRKKMLDTYYSSSQNNDFQQLFIKGYKDGDHRLSSLSSKKRKEIQMKLIYNYAIDIPMICEILKTTTNSMVLHLLTKKKYKSVSITSTTRTTSTTTTVVAVV